MKKSDRTKKRIIDSTVELIAEQGYADTSTKAIAGHADVSEALLFKYFKSKDNLLEVIVTSILDDFYEQSFARISKNINHDNVKDTLAAMLQERMEFFSSHRKEMKVIFQEMMINKNIKEMFENRIWGSMSAISSKVFEKGKDNGELRDIDNSLLKGSFFGMMFFVIFFELYFDIGESEMAPGEKAKKYLDIWLHGTQKEKQ